MARGIDRSSQKHGDTAAVPFALLPYLDQIIRDIEQGREPGASSWLENNPVLADEANRIGQQVRRLLRAGASLWEHAADKNEDDQVNPMQSPRATPTADAALEKTREFPPAAGMGVIDEYELLAELGRGGFGVVYRARQRSLGHIVAVKLLHPEKHAQPDVLSRTLQEWKAIGKLDHPNIVKALDARIVKGTPMLVTEFAEGEDLSKLIQRTGTVPLPLACEIIRQIADALHRAHERGVIHRDVKPHNVMYEERTGVAKLLDLGLARLSLSDDAQAVEAITVEGAGMGTMAYMPPEQWTNARSAGPPADVYALGCTFYHLLAGHVPYRKPDVRSLYLAHAIEDPPACPNAPAEIQRLIQAMLAKEPGRRPDLMRVIRQLDDYCVGPLGDLAPRLIEKLEKAVTVGTLPDELALISRHLPRLSSRRIRQVFADAGRLLGRKGELTGEERGLTALLSLYIELGQNESAYEIGLDIIGELPESHDSRHFAAIGALHSRPHAERSREFLLQEAVRLETEAQTLPAARSWVNLGPSLSTRAQAHHELWRFHRSRGEPTTADAHLQQALQMYHDRLRGGGSAFAHALYALALRDAGRLQESWDHASQALQREWFLREAQQLIVELHEQGVHALPTWEEHFRRWSLVAGEWPNAPERTSALRKYLAYLERRRLYPELLHRLPESPVRPSSQLEQWTTLCKQSARPPRETTLERGHTRIACTVNIWEFENPESVTVGLASIGLFADGPSYEIAEAHLSEMLFVLHDKLATGRWRRPPELEAALQWMRAHHF